MHKSTLFINLQKIYESLNKGFEIKSVFLDITKPFDKVCHWGITFKSKQCHASWNLLAIVSKLLRERKLGVVLNG